MIPVYIFPSLNQFLSFRVLHWFDCLTYLLKYSPGTSNIICVKVNIFNPFQTFHFQPHLSQLTNQISKVGRGWRPWEGAVKEERCPHPGNSLRQLRGPPGQIEELEGPKLCPWGVHLCWLASHQGGEGTAALTAAMSQYFPGWEGLLLHTAAGRYNSGSSGWTPERTQSSCAETAGRITRQAATVSMCRVGRGPITRAPSAARLWQGQGWH